MLVVVVLKVNAGESPGKHSWSWEEYENELLFHILTLVKSLTVYSLGDVCIHLCVHTCLYVNVCTYLFMCTCIHVCMVMYACVYVYIFGYVCVCLEIFQNFQALQSITYKLKSMNKVIQALGSPFLEFCS